MCHVYDIKITCVLNGLQDDHRMADQSQNQISMFALCRRVNVH